MDLQTCLKDRQSRQWWLRWQSSPNSLLTLWVNICPHISCLSVKFSLLYFTNAFLQFQRILSLWKRWLKVHDWCYCWCYWSDVHEMCSTPRDRCLPLNPIDAILGQLYQLYQLYYHYYLIVVRSHKLFDSKYEILSNFQTITTIAVNNSFEILYESVLSYIEPMTRRRTDLRIRKTFLFYWLNCDSN